MITSRAYSSIAVMLSLFVATTALGCNEQSTGIKFEFTDYDCGEVEASGDIFVKFPFKVIAENGLTISHIDQSCGCIKLLGNQFVGRHLPYGEEQVVHVNVESPELVGKYEGHLALYTDIDEAAPIMLRFEGVIRTTPIRVVSPSPIHLRPLIHEESEFSVQFNRLRLKDMDSLEFVKELSNLREFRIIDHHVELAEVANTGIRVEPVIRESHFISLIAPPRNVTGIATNDLSFAWRSSQNVSSKKGKITHSIPVVFDVKHPLQLIQKQLFLGYLNPAEIKKITVKAQNSEVFDQNMANVTCDKGFINAAYDKNAGLLRIECAAPAEFGKFTAKVKLNCKPDSLYADHALDLLVSGIVVPPGKEAIAE